MQFYSPRIFRFLTIFFMALICLIFGNLTHISWVKIELPKDRPEYKGTNASGIVYDQCGNILYHITSHEAWQFPNNERIFMNALHTIVYDESSINIVKYDLTAKNGWLNYNKRLGYLGESSVLIVNNPDPQQIITIYGSDIDLDLTRNYFTSSKFVKAVQNNSTITGIGFNYDRNSGVLHILSNVDIIPIPPNN